MSIELRAQIGALKKAKVVCVGDVMLDRFVYGDVSRISPEGPIPICRVQKETAMLGGAGNVVRNLVALGASVDFISLVGDDDIARDVERFCMTCRVCRIHSPWRLIAQLPAKCGMSRGGSNYCARIGKPPTLCRTRSRIFSHLKLKTRFVMRHC